MKYKQELQKLVDAYQDDQGKPRRLITGTEMRELHEELCRQSVPGITKDMIIADWNRRSPDDLW